jgi:hypothetical protein
MKMLHFMLIRFQVRILINKPGSYQLVDDQRHLFHCFHLLFGQLCFALQMELIVERMQDEQSGVPVKTVKSFISKVPSVFTGKLSN